MAQRMVKDTAAPQAAGRPAESASATGVTPEALKHVSFHDTLGGVQPKQPRRRLTRASQRLYNCASQPEVILRSDRGLNNRTMAPDASTELTLAPLNRLQIVQA